MLNVAAVPRSHFLTLSSRNWATARIVGLFLPLLLAIVLVMNPTFNARSPRPLALGFVVIVSVSLLALCFAFFLIRSSVRIKHYRVLLLSYGFLAYGGFSIIHALTIPDLASPDLNTSVEVYDTAAYLALLFAAAFFALAQTRTTVASSKIPPLWHVAISIAILVSLMSAFFMLAAFRPSSLASLALSSFPRSAILATATILLFGYVAWCYLKSYAVTHLPMQLDLAQAMIFFIEAQVIISISPASSWSAWIYHYVSFVGVAIALQSVLAQRLAGTTLRSRVEDGLALKVNLDTEVEFLSVLTALSSAIEARDNEAPGHNERIAKLCVRIGRAMDLDNTRLRVLAHAGLLHDIGKLALPDSVLRAPDPLNSEDLATLQTHPLLGLNILGKMNGYQQESAIIMAHHERLDGSGYPRGLAGHQIPIEARIIAVVDTYDALVSDGPGHPALDPAIALFSLRQESGIKFDSECVNVLLRVLASP